jgi:hypothetical protein
VRKREREVSELSEEGGCSCTCLAAWPSVHAGCIGCQHLLVGFEGLGIMILLWGLKGPAAFWALRWPEGPDLGWEIGQDSARASAQQQSCQMRVPL